MYRWAISLFPDKPTKKSGGPPPHSRSRCSGEIGDNIRSPRYRIRWRINVHRFASSTSAGVLSREESRRKTDALDRASAVDYRSDDTARHFPARTNRRHVDLGE